MFQKFGGMQQSYFKGIFELSFDAPVLQQQFGDTQQLFKDIFELSFDTPVLKHDPILWGWEVLKQQFGGTQQSYLKAYLSSVLTNQFWSSSLEAHSKVILKAYLS